MATPQYILLYEYDVPTDLSDFLNYCPGVWFLVISPGDITVTDDNSNEGYYGYDNSIFYNIKSIRVDNIFLSSSANLTTLIATDASFFYDASTTRLYLHFTDSEPPWGKSVAFGAAVGFTLGNADKYSYTGAEYEPVVEQIFNIKRKKDPLFYGLLNFTSGSVKIINTEGEFDDWKSRNLFAQPSRILLGYYGDDYSDFVELFTGSIGPTSWNWDSLTIQNDDVRKRLTQPIARNLLTQTDFSFLNDSNVDRAKPIAYGQIIKAESICLNEDETASTYTFLLCDTEFNNVGTLDEVLVEEVDKTVNATLDAAGGTFTLPTAHYNPGDVVKASFTMSIDNGVNIIKDLVDNYDKKPYLDSFWNTSEVDDAETDSRDTSLYVDDDTDLKDAIESVCSDVDAIFYAQNDGKYSIRIYDSARTYSKVILIDDWIGVPDVDGNEKTFLTSAIVKYYHNLAPADNEKEYYQYENTAYETTAFNTYKTLKNKVFETNLLTEADAIEKSETILDVSANVQDIITRAVPFETDSDVFFNNIEIMDFIVCDPVTRINGTPTYALYEVLGLDLNFKDFIIKITMRYVGVDPR